MGFIFLKRYLSNAIWEYKLKTCYGSTRSTDLFEQIGIFINVSKWSLITETNCLICGFILVIYHSLNR